MSVIQSIVSLPALPFWLFAASGIIVTGISFWRLWQHYFYYRLIHDTPTSRLRSAPQGYVELQGTAESLPGDAITSPLTGLPCVWWAYTIEKRVRSDRHKTWQQVESACSNHIFQLVDGDSRCLVNPTDAVVLSGQRERWNGSSRRPLPRAVQVGGEWRFPAPLPARDAGYRYTETLLLGGAPIYALGNLTTRRPAENFDASAELRQVLQRWKQDQQTLLARFDVDNSGYIDQQEWQQARQAAQSDVDAELIRLRSEAAQNTLEAPNDARPLLLSNTDPERTAVSHLRKAQIALLVFLAVGTTAAAVIVQRLAFAAS